MTVDTLYVVHSLSGDAGGWVFLFCTFFFMVSIIRGASK